MWRGIDHIILDNKTGYLCQVIMFSINMWFIVFPGDPQEEREKYLNCLLPKGTLGTLGEAHCIAANPSKPIISSTTVGHSGEGCNPSMSLEIKDIPVQYYREKHKVC